MSIIFKNLVIVFYKFVSILKTSYKIQETTANLNKSQQELKEAIATREAHYNTLKKRIRVMYEYGNSGYLEALLSSDNFSDFITRLEYNL